MDTRSKIGDAPARAGRSGRVHLARGWFDVLTAEHCRILQDAKVDGSELVVLVYRDSAERPSPLRTYDRAQMVAALSCVDWVLVCSVDQADSIAKRLRPQFEMDMDASQTRDVVRDVLALHRKH